LHPEANIIPSTLEGCLVKICDTMSYIGRDIEDAITMGIIQRKQIPSTVLGNTNREILSVLAADIIAQSYHKEYIALSKHIYDALHVLRKFNFEQIYFHPKLKVESSKIEYSFQILFEWLLEDLQSRLETSYLWQHFLHKRSEFYLGNTSQVQMVIDYIAGMTDQFFIATLQRIIVPSEIHL
jgi:dGTPase